MFEGFRATTSAVRELLRRLHVPKSRIALTTIVMLVGGAVEGATVGMLVPLLTMLTGKDSPAAGFITHLLPFLSSLERIPQVLVLAGCLFLLVTLKNVLGYMGTALGGSLRIKGLIELRRQLLARVLRAPPTVLEKHT